MRCRYSRKLYIIKNQFHSPDYIDDKDLTFIQNLITFHIDFVNNSNKAYVIDSSRLLEPFQSIFNIISANYPLINDSTVKTELYNKYDLEYKGKERHTREVRERIINYLIQKKGHIFTSRQVDFFLRLSLTATHDDLKRLCKEMTFIINSPRRPNPKVRRNESTKSINEMKTLADDNVVVETEETPLAERVTLFQTYLSMIHPPCNMDYEKVSLTIAQCFQSATPAEKTISTEKNDYKIMTTSIKLPEKQLIGIKDKNSRQKVIKTDKKLVEIPLTATNQSEQLSAKFNVVQTKAPSKPIFSDKMNPRKRHIVADIKVIDKKNSENLSIVKKKNKKVDQSEFDVTHQYQSFKEDTNKTYDGETISISSRDNKLSQPRRRISNDRSQTLAAAHERPEENNHCVVNVQIKSNEIIELSDDDDNGQVRKIPDMHDIDQMIDFLIHRCSIPSDMHPSLLRDFQMRIELNGFLLFVNISIRLSLRANIGICDKEIFDCIFISSIIMGLNCSVIINSNDININHLSDHDFHIAVSRLASIQVPVKDTDDDGDNSHSILINPDISRLIELSMFYVHNYHATGHLMAATDT